MTYSASLLVRPNRTLPFAVWESADGFPVDRQSYVVEPLIAQGVDGVRLRLPRKEWPEFNATTILDALTWAAAQKIAAGYRDSKGLVANLSVTTSGGSFTWRNLYIIEARPELVAGKIIGGGASSSNTCHVRCTWTLQATQNAEMTG